MFVCVKTNADMNSSFKCRIDWPEGRAWCSINIQAGSVIMQMLVAENIVCWNSESELRRPHCAACSAV